MQWRVGCLAVAVASGCGGPSPAPVSAPAPRPAPPKSLLESAPQPGEPASVTVTRFLGMERIGVILEAERVESYRIRPARAANGATVGGYPVVTPGPDLAPAQVDTLRQRILDPQSYRFAVAKECKFRPGVALRFRRGGRQVDLLLCFSCDEWEFVLGDDRAHEDFDPIRPALVGLAKQLFPADAAIQGLAAGTGRAASNR